MSATTFAGATATSVTVQIDGPLAERFQKLARAQGLEEDSLLEKALRAWIEGGEAASKYWLNAAEAVEYCGFRLPEYENPYKAFHSWIDRQSVPRGYAGTKLRFRRVDLDRAIAGQA